MDTAYSTVLVVATLALGFAIGRALAKADAGKRSAEVEGALKADLAALTARLESATAEKQHLRDTFTGVAADALRNNNEAFLQLAKTELARETTAAQSDLEKREKAITDLVAPIQKGLEEYQTKIAEIEKERATSFGSLRNELELVAKSNRNLESQTQALVNSLKIPTVRGRWGEIQLQNAVELAGMLQYCDFTQQFHITTDEGGILRPDMIVHLPGGRTIVVDSKVSLKAYLEAAEEADESRCKECLKRHAEQIRTHATALKKKSYWSQFEKSPEFVVMFIPGEVFFSAALQADPSLLEELIGEDVILATPTTLIALLKTAARGWTQELIVRDAVQINELGKELYDRMSTVCGHIAAIGAGLEKAVKAYNASVSSLESRFLVTGRKFNSLGAVAAEEIELLGPVEVTIRSVTAPELLLASEPDPTVPPA